MTLVLMISLNSIDGPLFVLLFSNNEHLSDLSPANEPLSDPSLVNVHRFDPSLANEHPYVQQVTWVHVNDEMCCSMSNRRLRSSRFSLTTREKKKVFSSFTSTKIIFFPRWFFRFSSWHRWTTINLKRKVCTPAHSPSSFSLVAINVWTMENIITGSLFSERTCLKARVVSYTPDESRSGMIIKETQSCLFNDEILPKQHNCRSLSDIRDRLRSIIVSWNNPQNAKSQRSQR